VLSSLCLRVFRENNRSLHGAAATDPELMTEARDLHQCLLREGVEGPEKHIGYTCCAFYGSEAFCILHLQGSGVSRAVESSE
jgi:hypothetical protein